MSAHLCESRRDSVRKPTVRCQEQKNGRDGDLTCGNAWLYRPRKAGLVSAADKTIIELSTKAGRVQTLPVPTEQTALRFPA